MADLSLKKIEEGFRKLFGGRRQVNPSRDWSILLLVALIVVLIATGISAWTYVRVDRGDFAKAPEESAPLLTIDRTRLSDVLAKWKARETVFQEALVSQPALVDPRK